MKSTVTEVFTSSSRLIDFKHKGEIWFSVGDFVEKKGVMHKYRKLKVARISTGLTIFGAAYVDIDLVETNQQLYNGKIVNRKVSIPLKEFVKDYKIIENEEEFIFEVITRDGYTIQQREDESLVFKKDGKEHLIEQEGDVTLSLAKEVEVLRTIKGKNE